MEPGLAFTLCGLGICFLIPAFILGFINRSKTTRCSVTTVATVSACCDWAYCVRENLRCLS